MAEEVLKVSSKGQVVLPSDVRRTLGISKGQRLAVTVEDGIILMKPVKRLSEMAGILKGMKIDSKKAINRLRTEWDLEL